MELDAGIIAALISGIIALVIGVFNLLENRAAQSASSKDRERLAQIENSLESSARRKEFEREKALEVAGQLLDPLSEIMGAAEALILFGRGKVPDDEVAKQRWANFHYIMNRTTDMRRVLRAGAVYIEREEYVVWKERMASALVMEDFDLDLVYDQENERGLDAWLESFEETHNMMKTYFQETYLWPDN